MLARKTYISPPKIRVQKIFVFIFEGGTPADASEPFRVFFLSFC